MSLNSQALPAPSEAAGKIKHLYMAPASAEQQNYVPRLYFEARIDFADVRSGYHVTVGVNDVLDFLPSETELVWTTDMVESVDPSALLTAKPPQVTLAGLPESFTADRVRRMESPYVSYLLRHMNVRVLRNFVLNAYSNPGETRDEFLLRCLEAFNDSFRNELEALRETVNRRLERIAERYIVEEKPGDFESERRMAQARTGLHEVAERITELFLQTVLTMEGGPETRAWPDSSRPDLEQSLEELEADVGKQIRRLLDSYREKILNVDEYIIHPGLKDLHLVRTCILWVPEEAPAR